MFGKVDKVIKIVKKIIESTVISIYLCHHCDKVGPRLLIVQALPRFDAEDAAVSVYGELTVLSALLNETKAFGFKSSFECHEGHEEKKAFLSRKPLPPAIS